MTTPFGSWKSPITADLIVSESIGLGSIALDGEDIYWVELRPAEKGRYVIVRRTPAGKCTDVTPPEFNARTRVLLGVNQMSRFQSNRFIIMVLFRIALMILV